MSRFLIESYGAKAKQVKVRANPKIAGTTHNVFGIQTGVAVMFLVKCDDFD